MQKPKVYFTSFKTSFTENIPDKLKRLILTAGVKEIDFTDKYAAIKIHFGELGNLAFLRPNYAKVVVDVVKELGGKAFLTDCNTLYVGSRKNALDHLDTAYENGFTPFSTGCHVIIGDGLKGTDEELVPVDGEYVKEAKIGRAVMDADVFISLTHFKGHEMTGFGGALKNIGMGCGSRAGKMEMHSEGKPYVNQEKCIGCGMCTKVCAHTGIAVSEKKASINQENCVGCGRCIGVCPKDAVEPSFGDSNDVLNCKMAEYSKAVLQGRPHFHISIVCDVSPNCDCHAENDIPIIPNVGMFASFDPVALDVACADACNRQPVIAGSVLHENKQHGHGEGHDHFHMTHPDTNWKSCVEHAEKIGIGSQEYELVEV
ncbi:MAG: DUF362 domain-containing protein [Lachnospiraceae bacterium]|jgi:uncharacterized Fe-S center protein|nr:DUF362 domain-containing protein [Lachnospiraceae bacterium]